jgi:hypothetical protein
MATVIGKIIHSQRLVCKKVVFYMTVTYIVLL